MPGPSRTMPQTVLILVSLFLQQWLLVDMYENLPLIYMNVRILKFWSLLYDHNWKRYFSLSLGTALVVFQFAYMFTTDEGIDAIIRNSYMLVLWVNTITRAYVLVYYKQDYENLLESLVAMYNDLRDSRDPYIRRILDEVNAKGRVTARGNLFLGLLTCIGFGTYPLLVSYRVLPFDIVIPGIQEYKTPFYQLLYVMEMGVTPIGCCMYIPFTSLIVSFIMFGIVMCKSLQHRLRNLRIAETGYDEKAIGKQIVDCILYQKCIINYVATVNRLTTYIFLLEFLAFGALLCALLFLLIIVDSFVQMIIVWAYVTMILAQIFALYWYANELKVQNLAVAEAAYEIEWFNLKVKHQKHVLLIILRAQRPSVLMVGNIRDITLELFQALLNASYTYFTILKRVYG